jgi:hypothetical protein
MSVLNAMPLPGRKATFVEAPRINEPEACRMSAPPRKTSCVARALRRTGYSVRGATVSAVQQRLFVGYAQGPVGGFLMTRLGPLCITPPRAAVHTAKGSGIGLTLTVGNISDPPGDGGVRLAAKSALGGKRKS